MEQPFFKLPGRAACALRLIMISLCGLMAAAHATEQKKTFNAMAPLHLNDETQWQAFEQHLSQARKMGIDGISVDIWWGKVEAKGDQQFDWAYYHRMAETLRRHDLKWIPIMSFHQCGGNVGDQCNIPIPVWIWNYFDGVAPDALKFRSEQGNLSSETLTIWQSEAVLAGIYKQYREFMSAFEGEFSQYEKMIQELNISMGPAGELRYPSYNSHDNSTGYPTRGGFQGLSDMAIQDFSHYLRTQVDSAKMASESLNQNGHDSLISLDFNRVFQHGRHQQPGFSHTLYTWYHTSLIDHGRRMLESAHAGFGGQFSALPLGYKIPGIHWTIASEQGLARAAEMNAGLIPPMPHSRQNHFGYKNILQLGTSFSARSRRDVIVHFTALEMSDSPWPPANSMAKTLVNWLASGAESLGVTLKGENALAQGVYSETGWQNIRGALAGHYSGLTILRLGDVANAERNRLGYREFTRLIMQYQNH